MIVKHKQQGVKHACSDCGKMPNRKDNMKQHQTICQSIPHTNTESNTYFTEELHQPLELHFVTQTPE